MNFRTKAGRLAAAWALAILLIVPALTPGAAAADSAPAGSVETTVVSDADLAGELGILQGDGSSLTAGYMGKATTRLQAAILFLRLTGVETEALSFTGTGSFADANLVWPGGQAILAYLKANPELGWTGIGDNRFDPLAVITAEQIYKVMLEAVGYKQDADFAFTDVIRFAGTVGLGKAAAAKPFKNVNIATVLIETLNVQVKGTGKSLSAILAEMKKIDSAKLKALQYDKLDFSVKASLGSFLVDGSGKTLYYFSKDAADPNACQGKCLENWPIFYADKMRVPAELDKKDFGVLVRADGTKQTTYKGWPLYYYVKDAKAGDTAGEAVGNVWFVVEAPSFAAIAQKEGVGSYLADAYGKTLYYFDKDTKGVSVCSGQCEANWPIFYQDDIQAPTGTKQEDFGVLVRADGSKQTTYKGYPLYYYVKDLQRGDTLGQGVGGVWYAVDPAAFTATKAADFDVKVVSTNEGSVLVDSKGMALYIFAKDEADLNSCQGKCLAAWPIFHSDSLQASTDLKAEDFGVFTRSDGTRQTTYRGWPLYDYVKDVYPGEITGQNVGQVWFLAGPDLTKPLKMPSETTAPDMSGKDKTIEISGFKFSVPELTVEAGAKVTFTNRDTVKHNAVAVDGSFSIPLLGKDESASITLDKPGVYEYYCEPHKSAMRAKIIVK